MLELYGYQNQLRYKAKLAMINGNKRILIQSPTGSGKTVTFSMDVFESGSKGYKCLILTDRIELLNGTDGTLGKFNIEATTITSGAKYPPNIYHHCIAMSQTLRRRLNSDIWLKFIRSFKLVIIDEAHIQEFNIYFEKEVFTKDQYVFGYTATPIRSKKQRQLSEDYSVLIEGPQVQELINSGHLVRDMYYAPKHFDPTGISLNTFGEYNEYEMFKKFEEVISYDSIINNWKTICNDTISIVFCSNTEHVLNTCKAFNDNGIKAKFIVSPLSKPKYDDEMTDEQFVSYKEKLILYEKYIDYMSKYSGNRDDVIEDWKSEKFKVLVNTNIYTKGFDHKPIETVIVLRATTSEALWLQMLGRGSRTFENKTHFNVLDFGSNGERLGMYAQERKFYLNHDQRDSSGVTPVKECGLIKGIKKVDKNNNAGCGCLILSSRKICNYCGYIFEQEKVEIDIDLVHINYNFDDTKSDLKYNDYEFGKLERKAEERGYKFSWVINQVITLGGIDALTAFRDYKNYKTSWIFSIEKSYAESIKRYNEKNKEKVLELPEEIEIQGKLLF